MKVKLDKRKAAVDDLDLDICQGHDPESLRVENRKIYFKAENFCFV